MFTPTLTALLLCVAAAIVEGLCAGPRVRQRLTALRVPRFAFPFWAWVGVGLLYYLACLLNLRELLSAGLESPLTPLATGLLLLMMAGNAAWNYVFFRRRALRASWLLTPPYSLLVFVVVGTLWRVVPSAALWLVPYALYQVYANVWVYAVWRLNRLPPSAAAI